MSKEFKIGDKVVCINDDGIAFLERGREYIVEGVDGTFLCIKVPIPGFFYSRFKLVEEPLKPPPFKESSFKNFLSPMCRVELGNGSRWIYADGEFITKGKWQGSENQYNSDGKIIGLWATSLSCGYEIVKVFDKPKSPSHYLDIEDVGEPLWECPELAAKRKEKAEKIAHKQSEINMAQRKLDELVKQLKEIG